MVLCETRLEKQTIRESAKSLLGISGPMRKYTTDKGRMEGDTFQPFLELPSREREPIVSL